MDGIVFEDYLLSPANLTFWWLPWRRFGMFGHPGNTVLIAGLPTSRLKAPERLLWAVCLLVASLSLSTVSRPEGFVLFLPKVSSCHPLATILGLLWPQGPSFGRNSPSFHFPGGTESWVHPILLNSHSLSLHLLLSTGLTSNPDLPSFQPFDLGQSLKLFTPQFWLVEGLLPTKYSKFSSPNINSPSAPDSVCSDSVLCLSTMPPLPPSPCFFFKESCEEIHWFLNRLLKDENSGFMSHLGFWKGRKYA